MHGSRHIFLSVYSEKSIQKVFRRAKVVPLKRNKKVFFNNIIMLHINL